MKLHSNISYSDSRAELSEYKDYRRGALDDAFWPEGELVDYRPRSKAKRKPKSKTRAGCPDTNYKAHVYVWTSETEDERHLFFQYFGYHKWEREICPGCGKTRKARECEKYMKRKERLWAKLPTLGVPLRRYMRGYSFNYWYWEDRDAGYQEFIKDWKTLHPNNMDNYHFYSTYSWRW